MKEVQDCLSFATKYRKVQQKKGGEKRDPFESLLRWNNHLLKVAKGAKFDHKRIHVFGTKAACRVSDVS